MARKSTFYNNKKVRIYTASQMQLENENRRFTDIMTRLNRHIRCKMRKRIKAIDNAENINKLKKVVSIILTEQRYPLNYRDKAHIVLMKALDKFQDFNPIKNYSKIASIKDNEKYHEYMDYSEQGLYLLTFIAENSDNIILSDNLLKKIHKTSESIDSFYGMQFFTLLEQQNKKIFYKFLSDDILSKQDQRNILISVEDYYVMINTTFENSVEKNKDTTLSKDI